MTFVDVPLFLHVLYLRFCLPSGVMGKEGRQAVRCADFAFARFKFLKKVLLVHGHWYYTRVSTLVQYSFYKNVAFITPQLYFAVMSAFSTQVILRKKGGKGKEKNILFERMNE